MKRLLESGPWPTEEQWKDLRVPSITDISMSSSWQVHVGLVYADGNSMGRVVQALDRPETCRHFSGIVDSSIHEACFSGLEAVLHAQIEQVRDAFSRNCQLPPLPADILLLGGDDLLVVVPAECALDFALQVTVEFERLTRERIAKLPDERTRRFFREQLGSDSFTISCGVAIAKSTYPFFLSLDLAEQLLRNAKRRGYQAGDSATDASDVGRIDFQVVSGANSHALEPVRTDTYLTATKAPRTLRPLTEAQLKSLRTAVQELRGVGFPRSKLHELQDAALTHGENQASRCIREILARSRHDSERSERHALWNAVKGMCPEGYTFEFPWFKKGDQRLSPVADLVDAYELFGHAREGLMT